jgi:hypothetical protein
MRNSGIQRSDNRIVKSYIVSREQRDVMPRYLPLYINWLKSVGFNVPLTELTVEDDYVLMAQEYISGRTPTWKDWILLLRRLVEITEFSEFGLDANPSNFLFKGEDIYFVDLYPLLVGYDKAFLSSQFSYREEIILSRYFERYTIIVCFLNRLKNIDEEAFFACYGYIKDILLREFESIPARDLRRLSRALTLDQTNFKRYYKKTKLDESELDNDEHKAIYGILAAYL